jgi:hypothetical protein
MDFECIDALLDLPEFRVTDQVIRPQSWNCISSTETRLSFVPGAKDAASGSKMAEPAVSSICRW